MLLILTLIGFMMKLKEIDEIFQQKLCSHVNLPLVVLYQIFYLLNRLAAIVKL